MSSNADEPVDKFFKSYANDELTTKLKLELMKNSYILSESKNELYPSNIVFEYSLLGIENNILNILESKHFIEKEDGSYFFKVKLILPNDANHSLQIKVNEIDIAEYFRNKKSRFCIPDDYIKDGKINIKTFNTPETIISNDSEKKKALEFYTNHKVPETVNKLDLSVLVLEFKPYQTEMCLTRKFYINNNNSNFTFTTYHQMLENGTVQNMIDDRAVDVNEFNSLPKWIPKELITNNILNIKKLTNDSINTFNFGILDPNPLGGTRFHRDRLSRSRKNSNTNKRQRQNRFKKSGNKSGTNRQGRGKIRGYK